ncbi:hypothetical protein PVAND_014660 [Polypedilum vanderplanki]|uniref:F-box domain-containing protein n=1 Tax=Polypedilum vanderplanki TaxID=319348 RepID=A0A9J6BA07_POLVA|nr:hypothetical protein PVAND_014660 [Polypedilum vanderplanki]
MRKLATIYDLPLEILFKIFHLLDKNSIENLSNVSQKFQTIIFTSKSLMSQFNLQIIDSNFNTIHQKSSKLPYHKISIFPQQYHEKFSINEFDSKLNKILDEHRDFIEEVQLFGTTAGLSTAILSDLKNLQKLVIDKIKKSGKEDHDYEDSVSLPNLKILEVKLVNSYLKCIKNHQVETLKVEDIQIDPTRVSRALNTFLRNCKHLKNFSLIGTAPNFEVKKFKFKLEKFSFKNLMMIPENMMDMPMMALLKSQQETVKDLTLTALVSNEMLTFAYNELNLETLTIDMEKIFANFKKLKIAENLKFLEIKSLPNNLSHAKALITASPNIGILKISSIFFENSADFLQHVAVTLKNLKDLSIFSLNSEIKNEYFFESVEILNIYEIKNSDHTKNLVKFVKACPKIKKLKISDWDGYNITPQNFLNLAENVEIIEICGNFVPNVLTAAMLRHYSNDLKLKILFLDVNFNDDVDGLINELEETKIQLICPDWIRLNSQEVKDDSDCEMYEESEELSLDNSDIDDKNDSENEEESFDENECYHDQETSEYDSNSSIESNDLSSQFDSDENSEIYSENKETQSIEIQNDLNSSETSIESLKKGEKVIKSSATPFHGLQILSIQSAAFFNSDACNSQKNETMGKESNFNEAFIDEEIITDSILDDTESDLSDQELTNDVEKKLLETEGKIFKRNREIDEESDFEIEKKRIKTL